MSRRSEPAGEAAPLSSLDAPEASSPALAPPQSAPGAARARRLGAQAITAGLGAALIAFALAARPDWMQRHVLPDLLFPLADQLAVLLAVRLLAAAAGLLLLGPVRSRLGGLFARKPVGRVLADCAPILVAVLLALVVSEVLLRSVPALTAVNPLGEPLRRRDPVLGWAPVPGHTGRAAFGGRTITYAFDAAGDRIAPGAAPVDPVKPTILFAGESILFGLGLDWPETIPAQVQALTGVQAANLAVEGYATDQAFLRLKQQWPRFQHPAAVVLLFAPGIFYRNLAVDRPHLEPGLTWRPPAAQSRLLKVARWLVPYRSAGEIDRGVIQTRQVLQAAQGLAAARGAPLLVVVPQFAPETATETSLRRRILDDGHIPYVIARVPANGRIRGDDVHPDARSAQTIGVAVAAWLTRHGVGKGSDRAAAAP